MTEKSRVYGQTNIVLDSQVSNLTRVLHEDDTIFRKTKIVCTLGPSSTDETLLRMIDEGMNVARFNCSHGDQKSHGEMVARLNAALAKRPGKHVAMMLDMKGPGIRTGFLKNGTPVDIKEGSEVKVITDYSVLGDASTIACSYKDLPKSVSVGTKILVADGALTLKVTKVGEDYVITTALNNYKLGDKKNINLPGCHVNLPFMSQKDIDDVTNLAIPKGFTFISASFAQTADNIRQLRECLGKRGSHVKIIAKIENESGLEHFEEIMDEADGIMVARGDLGMEIPSEKVFLAQKMMTGKCNLAGKPVIVATQMLESMVKNPRPTRAEATDVANAVLDGADAVMLSGETANGDFPQAAVHMMRRICQEAERVIDYPSLYDSIVNPTKAIGSPMSIAEGVCCSAVQTAMDTEAALLLALTETGHTARLMAKYRPKQPILALAASESVVKHLQLVRGIVALQVPSFQGTANVINSAIDYAKRAGLVSAGDRIVAVHGMLEEVSGHSNLMKVLEVPQS